MTNECLTCSHNQVCKLKDNYEEFLEKYNEALKYLKNYNEALKYLKKSDEAFDIELNCPYYREIEPISKGWNLENIVLTSTNQCEGCSIYEDIKKGKVVINDACSFCSKSPYKIEVKENV